VACPLSLHAGRLGLNICHPSTIVSATCKSSARTGAQSSTGTTHGRLSSMLTLPTCQALGREVEASSHRNLVARLLAIRGMSVVSGYYHPIYNPLEQSGWKRVDCDVPTYSPAKRTRRTECLWLSPNVLSCEDKPIKTKPSTPEDRMKDGAHHTHEVRVAQTTRQIVRTIDRLRKSGEEPTMTAVARIVGVSREHVSRRYRHLFRV
jgi:DNA adenine methylase